MSETKPSREALQAARKCCEHWTGDEILHSSSIETDLAAIIDAEYAALRGRADAAGDLLEALKDLEDAAEGHYNVGVPGVDPDLRQMIQARAAIAKAEACQPPRETPGRAGEEGDHEAK